MQTQTVSYAVATTNGVITDVGRSTIVHPKINFKGGTTKWFDDSKLLKKDVVKDNK